MANEQAGGSVPGAGQATIGEDTRKLEKTEAGFRVEQGVAGLQCGDCLFFQSGECQIVEGPVDQADVCDQFEPNTKDGNMTAEQATEIREKPLSSVEMFITRVSKDKQTGVRRWYATTSGIKRDLYDERMSVSLFKDFVKRIESRDVPPVPFSSDAWNGGLPYLGVAHYLDLGGVGIVGPTEQIWIDGKVLKAKGTFEISPLAEKSFDAIQEDIATKRADDERVRISIAFIDWGHNHGRGRNKSFKRKSLRDQCMLCEAGVGDKQYTAGQLVHFALTRRPAYIETSIVALEERSMSKRQEDAASIIGDELAEELEARSREIIGRSDDGEGVVASGAVVIKDVSQGQEDEAEVVERDLGGAQTLDDAEAFLTKTEGDSVLLDSWEILSTILGNIAGGEHRAEIREVVRDFQSTLDVQTAQAVLEVQRALGGETVSEKTKEAVERQVPPQFRKDEEEEERQPKKETADEEEVEEEEMDGEDKEKEDEEEDYESKSFHPLETAFSSIRKAYDEAIASTGDPGERLGLVQDSFNTLGEEIRRQVEEASASAPVTADSITRTVATAIAEATAPLMAEIAGLRAEVASGAKVEKSTVVGKVPGRRAIRMPPSTVPAATIVQRSTEPTDDNPTPKLRNLVRKSTIGFEKNRGL